MLVTAVATGVSRYYLPDKLEVAALGLIDEQCDKRHPSCLRCEKFGKPCPGYDKKRKFVDEGETLRKKYQADINSESVSLEVNQISGPEMADD